MLCFWRDKEACARPHCHRDRLDCFRYGALMMDARRKRLKYRANYRTGTLPVPANYDTPLLQKLKAFDPSKV